MEQTPTPSFLPTGRTRVLSIIGHPIKQVRSPIVVNTELARRGIDAVLVPINSKRARLAPSSRCCARSRIHPARS